MIYLPATERQSHYFHVRPSEQFDAMIHIDNTCALEPLELTSEWIAGEVPRPIQLACSAEVVSLVLPRRGRLAHWLWQFLFARLFSGNDDHRNLKNP